MGKTWLGAALVPWALACFPLGMTVLTTAPTARQVEEQLWRGVHAQINGATIDLGGHLTLTKYERSPECFALGLSTNDPSRFQGFHNDRVLVIVDEAAGVDRAIFGAVDGVVVGIHDTVLMLGNTTSDGIGGAFHECFTGARAATTFNISTWEAAEAGCTGASLEWCEEKLQRWGETDAEYLGRVMGQWPDASEHALIAYGDVKAALEREPTSTELDRVVIGVDVARYGEDRTVWAVRRGEDILAIHEARQQSLVETFKDTQRYIVTYGAQTVVTDDTGLGGGLTDMLVDLAKQPTVGINFGAKALREDEYVNRRTEIWFALRDWFREGRGALLPNCTDRQLILDAQRDCVSPLYQFSNTGQRKQLEHKEQLKKRTAGRSPDIGDALALAFAVDSVGNPFSVAKDVSEAIDFWDGIGSVGRQGSDVL